MEQVKYPGVVFDLGVRKLIVPSLSLLQVKENDEALKKVPQVDPTDPSALINVCLPLVGLAVRRNYPDISDEQLLEWIDMVQLVELVKLVQYAAGYSRVTSVGGSNADGTDWRALVGKLVRATGWTFEQCWDQPADESFALLEHLWENPPEYEMAAMYYGWKGRKPAAKTEKQEQEEAAERSRAAADAGLQSRPMPAHIAEIVGWCDEQDELLGAKKP